jgi:hypothetical protein
MSNKIAAIGDGFLPTAVRIASSRSRLAGRSTRLPDLRQHLRVLPRLLPRLLRDRVHRDPLLVPVAKALDVNLVWLGVLLCVNMQTSFMHPPFGFALFDLRGIAPKEVKSSDIYWGPIPWIILQIILVGVVIAWPQSVTYRLGSLQAIDQEKVQRTLNNLILPGVDSNSPGGLPGPDLPPPPKVQKNGAKR